MIHEKINIVKRFNPTKFFILFFNGYTGIRNGALINFH